MESLGKASQVLAALHATLVNVSVAIAEHLMRYQLYMWPRLGDAYLWAVVTRIIVYLHC